MTYRSNLLPQLKEAQSGHKMNEVRDIHTVRADYKVNPLLGFLHLDFNPKINHLLRLSTLSIINTERYKSSVQDDVQVELAAADQGGPLRSQDE